MPVLLIALVRENRFQSGCIFVENFQLTVDLTVTLRSLFFAGKFNHTWYGCERDTKIESSNDGRRH